MTPIQLHSEEIAKAASDVPDWRVVPGALEREYRFETFSEAFGFMTEIAIVAERMGHHPEWTNSYNRLYVKLSTHDVGGITRLDFELARQMDAVFSRPRIGIK